MLKNYFPNYDKLDNPIQEKLEKNTLLISFKKGQILTDSSICVGLIIIKKGSLRAFIESENAKQITLYHLYDHDVCLFGANCVFSDIEFEVMIQALEDTTVFLIQPEVYKSLLNESIILSNYFNKILQSRFSSVIEMLQDILFKKLDDRLWNYLLSYQKKEIKITHEEIAADLGSSREVITRMLHHLKEEGKLELSRNKIVLKIE